jgi:pimeloyl-ACP methyl ester carboxylesterase
MMSSISRGVLTQFDDWITNDAFRSADRTIDYRAGLPSLTLPVLVMGGSRDRLAPPECLRAQFEVVGSPDKTLIVLGPENGDAMDYGHGDLIFGSGAPSEAYPRILRWLEARATRIS